LECNYLSGNGNILMKRLISWKNLVYLVILLGLAAARPASAQQITKMTVSPPRLQARVNPGQVLQKTIKIHNGGDSEMALQIKIKDFIVSDDKGTPLPVQAKVARKWAASTWIQASPMKFIIRPGQTKMIDVAIVVPNNANPGGHYAVLFFQPVGSGVEKETASAVMPSVGSLFYLTVPGNIKENAFVVRMNAPRWVEYGPVKITSEIENLSDVHIRPRGTVRIYNWFGKLNSTLKLGEKNIFPGTVRRYDNTWQQHFGFGKYRATLAAGYGQRGQALTATIFFWVIPWHIILAIILAVILVGAVVWYRRRKRMLPGDSPASEA